ncbi:MAG TPA: hypothetical protein VIJ00_04380 [Nakamurella sp.]
MSVHGAASRIFRVEFALSVRHPVVPGPGFTAAAGGRARCRPSPRGDARPWSQRSAASKSATRWIFVVAPGYLLLTSLVLVVSSR